jgi:hypothetical protein
MTTILGHRTKLAQLKKLFVAGNVTQSYLFAGPRGVGKFLVAEQCAALLTGEPDGQALATDRLVIEPELVEKKGKIRRKNISVEQLRAGLHFLEYYPSQGKYRVLIIRDAEKLSLSAQNILLKSLEEPRSTAVIILTTHEPSVLLPTVLSRVSEERFGLVPEEELREVYTDELLEQKGIPLFFRTLGLPGLLSLACSDPEAFQIKKAFLKSLYQMSTLSFKERIALAEELSQNKELCDEVLEWWVPGLEAAARRQSSAAQIKQYYAFLEALLTAREYLRAPSVNTRLVLEELFFAIP